MGIEDHGRAPLQTDDESKRYASFRVFADQVVSEERLKIIKTSFVAASRSKHLFVCYKVASNPVHIEETVAKLVIETLITSYDGSSINVLGPSQTIVAHTVSMTMNSLELVSVFSETIIGNPGFIASVATLHKS